MSQLKGSTQEQIEELKRRIELLKEEGETELRRKLSEARKVVSDLEAQLSSLTGRPSASAIQATAAPRGRRPSINDRDLQDQVLKVMALHGKEGLNAKKIAVHVHQDPMRLRKFLKENPDVLKRQGAGPGTKFFLP
jgi:hypothetical protein